MLLGIIQGLTEWLPISSTGHLKLAEHFLKFEVPIVFDVALHVGTLIVVLLFFRKEIKKVVSAFWRLDFKTEHGKLLPLIIVGTIPTAIIGFAFGEQIENVFKSPLPISIAFIFCGILLYSTKAVRERTENIECLKALLIGAAQGIAIIPGFSRSGATIAVALLLGIKREKAFTFSFLLSVPAILGALGLTVYKEFDVLTSAGLGLDEVIVGVAVAMVVGFFALKLLWKVLAVQKMYFFAFYCWFIGAVLITLWLSGF
jgi:undecaprenyl-diphosphatase